MDDIIIRKAELRDVDQIFILNEQLGYKTTLFKRNNNLN